MEGAGNEPFSGHTTVSETTDGDFWLAADLSGVLFYRVFLCPLAGCNLAHAMVGSTVGGYVACIPHTCQMDGGITHSFGSHYHHECRYWLLGLLSEAARPFLRCRHRYDHSCWHCVAVPSSTSKVLSSPLFNLRQYGYAVSIDRFLCPFGSSADGCADVAIGRTYTYLSHHCFGSRNSVDSLLASTLL